MVNDQSMERKLRRLRIWNISVGLVLAVQAAMIAVLTNNFSLPVTATFMSGPPGTTPELYEWFSISTGWGVFAFLLISALALLIIASPMVFPWYKRNLLESRNYGRWIEYFFSSSIMIVLISQICGISDIAALLAIFGINASMILFGALQEKYEKILLKQIDTFIYMLKEFHTFRPEGDRIVEIYDILLDGLEYLISNNEFRKIQRFIRELIDEISEHEGLLLIPVSPYAIDTKNLKLLEREMEVC